MNTIYRNGKYELVKHSEGLAPYAIFVQTDRGFTQQVSKWYCTAGWASRKMKQLVKQEQRRLKCSKNNN